MASAYFDASALVKLGVHERESEALVDFLQQPLDCSTSPVAYVETTRALRRLKVPQAEIDVLLTGFFLIEPSEDLFRRAGLVDPLGLRTLDAIHLASALWIDDPELQFVTYDDRLARAAEANGLAVVQPGITAAGAHRKRRVRTTAGIGDTGS